MEGMMGKEAHILTIKDGWMKKQRSTKSPLAAVLNKIPW
jgi:hypothetical protein